MARLLRWTTRLLVVLVVLALVVALAGVALVRRPFPVVSGETVLAELDAPVEVHRDAFGVAHVYARSGDDLFRAQGYVHAQDRFWQMDFWRHIGTGRLAELFGESEVERDRFIRTLGWEDAARADLEVLDAQTRRYLEMYATGVNAYLEERSGTGLGLEYAFLTLRKRGYRPEPWTPVDTLVWLKVMSWDLRSNLEHETERAILSEDLPVDRLAELWPPYPSRNPTILDGPDRRAGSASAVDLPPGAVGALRDVHTRLDTLDGVVGPAGAGIGSNSWVVAGERTASGKPLLANDPHLGPQMPSIWYEMGLHCLPDSTDCPFDVAGFTFPGAPGVIVGHNDRIAWGVTNFNADVTDLYVEKVDPQRPNFYERNGEWVQMQVDEEVIEVAGGTPVTHEVRRTVHGPVISDVSGTISGIDEDARVEVPADHAISLRWTALEPSRTARAVLELNRARDWDDFRAALSFWDVPSQNFVYADVDGNIGYRVPGRVPVRRSGDGRWPVPGWTDEHAWTGWLDADDLPGVLNPSGQYLVTANNPPWRDPPVLLGTDWSYGFRARRIVEMIDAQGAGLTRQDMSAMQADATNLNARRLVPVLEDLDLSADPELRRARDLLVDWDRTQPEESGPAVLFNAFWRALLARTFHDELPEAHLPDGSGRWFEVVNRLLAEPGNAWWDDRRTSDQVETRNDMLTIALRDGLREVENALGTDPGGWRWGDRHGLVLEHPSFGTSGIGVVERVFNRGPYAVGGGDAIVNANGWNPPSGYAVDAVPSFRMVVDLDDFDETTAIHISGQSGHAFHPHYDDMAPRWAANETLPFAFTREAVLALSRERLLLVPEEAPGAGRAGLSRPPAE